MDKQHFLISRTDGIGDAILTLPLAGALKREFPNCKISFLGRTYTKAIVKACVHIDEFVNFDEVKEDLVSELKTLRADTIFHVFPQKVIAIAAKAAGIQTRIGTARRWYMIQSVNKPLFYSRKKSELHEAQLNLKMLQALNVKSDYSLSEIAQLYGVKTLELPERLEVQLDRSKTLLVLHPLSHGSALEWPTSSFGGLIDLLPEDEFQVIITGTQKERDAMSDQLPWEKKNVLDFTASLNLDELFSLCANTDALIAASTGPLHMAAAAGTVALGLYSPKQPIWPKRWQAIGANADFLVCKTHPENGALPFTPDEVFLKLKEMLLARETKS
jgi:ADP-heptose:LPS heptosyltransferase